MDSRTLPPFNSLVQRLFHTKTIGPSYKPPHILYVLHIIGGQSQGVGRYRIRKEVGLGEGSVKTLLNRLKDEMIIRVEGARQRGHVLTPKGRELYNYLSHIISIPQFLPNLDNKYVIGYHAAYCLLDPQYLVPNFGQLSVPLRDEAIKIGGTGCSTLEYNGNSWFFLNSTSYILNLELQPSHAKKVKKGSILVIGGGESHNKAVLATFAACLRLIKSL